LPSKSGWAKRNPVAKTKKKTKTKPCAKPLLFKVLDLGGKCRNGGHGTWHLPHGSKPGKWMPKVKGEIEACVKGYHVCTIGQLLNWLGPEVFVVEVRGDSDRAADKSAHAQARLVSCTYWNETNARLFAADCAERVLPLFEKVRPNDTRVRDCIEVVRSFALGRATQAELYAAWDAARAAARAAAGAAARANEKRWQARRLLSYLTGARGRKHADA
jgi:hypothetical protein